MSVEVISVQPNYVERLDEPYQHTSLSLINTVDVGSSSSSCADSGNDSDAGYSTPAENFIGYKHSVAHAQDTIQHPISSAAPSAIAGEDSGAVMMVDTEMQERIIKQVEWYFSDENLLKDSFLMKHINRNKEGYVSLKLVASLRKVKALTKDWKVVLASLEHSAILTLNQEKTKIRRNSPAPRVDYSHVSRTILISNYPEGEQLTVANIEQQFGKFGDVGLVRILHPGRAVPLDVKPCKTNHSILGKELCILVEYDSDEGAKVACRKFKNQQSWRDEIKVELLGNKESKEVESSPPSKPSQENKRKTKKVDQRNNELNSNRLRGKQTSPAIPSIHSSPYSSHELSPSPNKQLYRRVTPPTNRQSSASFSPEVNRSRRGKGGAKCSPELSRKFLHPDAWKDYTSDSGFSTSSSSRSSPEPTKRIASSSFNDLSSTQSWRHPERHVTRGVSCVIRQPIGPDGTKGFSSHRNTVS